MSARSRSMPWFGTRGSRDRAGREEREREEQARRRAEGFITYGHYLYDGRPYVIEVLPVRIHMSEALKAGL